MNRPRLLAVSGVRPWPARGGFSLRAGHLLDALARDWDISVVVAAETDAGEAGWTSPERHDVSSVPLGIRWRAVPRPRADYGPLRRTMRDLVAARSPRAALLFVGTEFLAFDERRLPPAVADRIDCATLDRLRFARRFPARSPEALARAVRAARYERRVVRSLPATTVVGEADQRALELISGRGSVRLIPNGVHIDPAATRGDEGPVPTVAFTGTLSYYANDDAIRFFTRRIWPRIRSEVEGARLILAGRRPTPRTAALESEPGIDLRVDVADMSSVLREAWVSVAPMRCGVGVKNKVLEAWAVGRPVVMTPMAANGLHLDPTNAALVHRDADRFAAQVIRLLRDADLRARIGAAARASVDAHHDWSRSARAMSDLLRRVAGLDAE